MVVPSRHEEQIGAAGRDLATSLLRLQDVRHRLLVMASFSQSYTDEQFIEIGRQYAEADGAVQEELLRLKTWVKGENDGET